MYVVKYTFEEAAALMKLLGKLSILEITGLGLSRYDAPIIQSLYEPMSKLIPLEKDGDA